MCRNSFLFQGICIVLALKLYDRYENCTTYPFSKEKSRIVFFDFLYSYNSVVNHRTPIFLDPLAFCPYVCRGRIGQIIIHPLKYLYLKNICFLQILPR